MKVKRIVAGILAAGVVATSGSLPATNVIGLSVVSEAVSKLNAPKITTKNSTTNTITLKWNAVSGAVIGCINTMLLRKNIHYLRR